MSTAIYAVEGMMCESCMAAVLENVHALSGVTLVAMDLVAGGQSPLIVTSGTKLGADAVRDAIELVSVGDGPSTRHDDTQPDRERSKASKDAEGRGAHPLPSRGTCRRALASKASQTGTVPVHFPSTAVLVQSTRQPAIASAGGRGF